MEYAGFLDWLWHRGDTPCDLVDLSDVRISYPGDDGSTLQKTLLVSLGLLSPDTIAHNRLWDLAEPLRATERLRYRKLWDQLLSENAPLRVLDGDKLVSAPMTFFDDMLVSLITEDWQKATRIIGMAIAHEMDEEVLQSNDAFLASRLNAMGKDARLEVRGDPTRDIHLCEVRLAQARRPIAPFPA
jgi:Protein of unknown function